MAINVFELGFVLKAVDQMSGVLRSVETRMTAMEETAKGMRRWREAGQNLAIAGGAIAAAGGVVALGLKSAVDSAMAMQAEMAHVATAVNDGADTMRHLAEVQRVAEGLAARGVIGVEQLGQAYYIARSNMLSHTQALKAIAAAQNLVTATTQNAVDAQAAMEPTTRTLTTLYENFGGSLRGYADQMAKLQSAYAFRDIGEVTYALQYAMPAAKGAGIAVGQMNAALALLSSAGLHGAEAGTGFAEFVSKLTTDNKLLPFVARTRQGGLDLQATLQHLSAAFGGLAPLKRARELKQLGFGQRDIRGVELMLDKIGQFAAIQKDLANSHGAAGALAATRMAAADERLARLANSWALLKEALGAPLLGGLSSMAGMLASALARVAAFAEAHPKIARFIATFAAITAGVLLLVGGLGVLLGGLAFLATVIAPVAAFLGVSVGWLTLIAAGAIAAGAAILTFGGAIIHAFSAVLGWLEAHWKGALLAFVTGPFGLAAIAINEMFPSFFHAGVNLLKQLGAGIESAALYPVHAIEKVVTRLRSYLPFSPAKEGPLRDLHRVRIVETIAESMRPAPMITAMRRVVLATAIAAPLMVGAATPAFAGGPGAQVMAAASAAPITINVSYNITGNADDFVAAAKAHRDELLRLLEEALARRARLMFN